MSMAVFILVSGLFLAYANGANDNFKGVATLFGSGASNYKRALYWATLTTFLGSLAALFLSKELVVAFSGKGLVSDSIVQMPLFLFSVALGSAATVWLATAAGFPVSTTHALVGGLMGAGLASGHSVHFQKLSTSYFLPLLFSPIVSLLLTRLIYPVFQYLRSVCGVNGEICLCIDGRDEAIQITPGGAAVLKSSGLVLTIEQLSVCQTRYRGSILGLSAQSVLDRAHYLTAGAVGFARGLNDTPKIVALLIAAQLLAVQNAVPLVGIVIALGGALSARKVAQTMSKKITPMNHGQGFTANLVAAFLVSLASFFSLPVSTTHVTCGSIFGIGWGGGKADWSVVRNILMSWLITLPLSALFSAAAFWIGKSCEFRRG